MAVAARPALVLPGLKPVDRSLETHWVRPGAATAVPLHPDDRIAVVNRDGGQIAELTALDTEGGEDAAALGARADVDATVLRELVRDGAADGFLGELHAKASCRTTPALCACSTARPRPTRWSRSSPSARRSRSSRRPEGGSSTASGPPRRF